MQFDGHVTAAITWSATNATLLSNIETALEALNNIDGVTMAEASLTNGIGTLDITFSGSEVAKKAQNLITVHTNSLTGTAPTLAIAEQTAGVDATFRNAAKGAVLVDTTNGNVYVNGGSAGAPTWQLVPDGLGATASVVVAEEVSFTETTGAGIYTGSVSVPAGATLLDIIVNGVALWTATTSAAMDVGDGTDPNGYFAGIDLKATDLLAGESLSFALAGGKAGAYIANSQVSPRYSASARTISGVVVTVGAAGNAGRTRMTVVYSLPTTTTAATKA